MYQHVKIPAGGQKITVNKDFSLNVPDNPIIPYIEGDGTGFDITPVMIKVVDAAVAKAYGGKRRIHWMEIYAGEKSTKVYGPDVWLPDETLAILKDYVVSIKGPLTTPVGGGIRSLNVALRQELDLYVCLRPVRWFKGVPSPVKEPEKTDMVIFRENAEDIYAGIEWHAESAEAKKLIEFLINEMGVKKIRFPATSGIGIKPVSRDGTVPAGAQGDPVHDRQRPVVADVGAQGQHPEVHRGRVPRLGLRTRAEGVRRASRSTADRGASSRTRRPGRDIVVKDVICDAFLQQILLRPAEYSVIATLNLNGDYISDALAAQVGGIGIAPGANLSDSVAMFEATHGTAPKYAGKDYVNPGSEILSAEMMLVHMGWKEAADADHGEPREGDRRQGRHLRLRAADAGRDAGIVLGLRQGDDRTHVTCGLAGAGIWIPRPRDLRSDPVPGAPAVRACRGATLRVSSCGTHGADALTRCRVDEDRAAAPGTEARQIAWMFDACLPLGPCASSKLTFWPSLRDLNPGMLMAEKCAKRSSPPPSGVMKPKPFASLNHLTVPVAIMLRPQ